MDLLLINEPLGEEIFIGILTSITISIFFYIKYKVANRKVTNMSQAEEVGRNCEILKIIVSENNNYIKFCYEKNIIELLEKWNPKQFLEPYNPDKLRTSVELYAALRKLNLPGDKRSVLHIRKIADEALDIKLNSEEMYTYMRDLFNPNNYIDSSFDKDKLVACSWASEYISENKEDIRKLEQLAYRIGLLKL